MLVVAKAPLPGRAKTRLAPPLSAEQAADLGRALLVDTLVSCRAEVEDVGLLHADADEAEVLLGLAGPATPLVRQQGRGLEDALAGAMATSVGAGPVALVSSDVPGLPPGSLDRAFAALADGADVVLGPALDGGYWLIAMRELHTAPFRDIPWSTPAVYAVTRERCARAGLRVHVLDPWRDVDTVVDLEHLLAVVDELPGRRTRDLLRRFGAAGVVGKPPPVSLERSELLAGSPWRAVVRDQLVSGDGAQAEYTYLAVPRAVFVVPVTGDGELVLVRQYRHPVRDWMLEVPAGSAADGESPLAAAKRELAEETGGRSGSWRHLSTFYSSSAHVSLRSDAFLATGVELSDPSPDEDEDLAVVRMPVGAALARARAGGFAEGQTALAMLLAAPHLEGA